MTHPSPLVCFCSFVRISFLQIIAASIRMLAPAGPTIRSGTLTRVPKPASRSRTAVVWAIRTGFLRKRNVCEHAATGFAKQVKHSGVHDVISCIMHYHVTGAGPFLFITSLHSQSLRHNLSKLPFCLMTSPHVYNCIIVSLNFSFS